MIKTLPSVTIGIPAYNEVANIAHLVLDILSQDEQDFVLEKVLILSDGSSDETVAKARTVSKDDRVVVVDDRTRKGKAARLNEIIKQTKSDVLVLLDADVQLGGRSFLRELIFPVIHDGADLSTGRMLALKPRRIVEYALDAGLLCKNLIFESWRSGENVYTCCGVARAFSRRGYESLRFSDSVGEDAYSYFYMIKAGLRYVFAPNAHVLIKHPGTIADYLRQSRRFVQSRGLFLKEFGVEFVEKEYAIPIQHMVSGCLQAFIRRPISFSAYIVLNMLSHLKALSRETLSQTWEIATSSKRLHP